ncbi:MAG: ABC transporter ATP-binding protein, partial [Clostridiales bacterium]|nr:ABC transporter ATP-binding protein [Clostridiales bacterium]
MALKEKNPKISDNSVNERAKFDFKTLKRLLSYMGSYKLTLVFAFVCIIISAGASVASSMFIETLIDNYITPLLAQSSPVFSGLLKVLCFMAAIYLIGTLCTWLYNRAMVNIAQGTLKSIRDEMFEKMQSLPVKFFDTHSHGDVMSLYTNDTDTLRQMIAQSMAQLISCLCTVIAVFCCMLYESVYLTLIVIAFMFVIFAVIRAVTNKSGSYFILQQSTLGELDGYVEEMVNGQKVVKVFCHENAAKSGFAKRNDAWKNASSKANGYANSVMPIMNALG